MSDIDDIENDVKRIHPHTGAPLPPEPPTTPPAAAAGNAAAEAAAAHPTPHVPSPEGATGAPSQQELAIRSALETVMDPEIGLSVIDLGLIREVHVEAGRTHVRMMLTTPFCPYAPQMVEDVKQASRSVVDQETEVEIMPDAWSPDLMPDPGLLGYSF